MQENTKYDKEDNTISLVMDKMPTYGSTDFSVIKDIRAGLTRKDFMAFAKRIGRSIASLEVVIPASYSTLTKKSRYDMATSERLIELAQLFAFGQTVFGDFKRLNAWLDAPLIPLGELTPFSLLDTSMGIRQVRDQIGRIAHGIAV